MATKIFVTLADGPANDAKSDAIKHRVADALGICCEDVVVLNGIVGLNVVEVPAAMTAAREKADKQAAHEAEVAAKEAAKAEEAAAKAEAKAAKVHA